MIDPINAAVLSLFVPGLGQLATGKPGRAVYFGFLALFVWVVSFALFGWIIHILAALDAWYRAQIPACAVTPTPTEPLPDNVIVLHRR
mgnify:CR=1 FL=1